VENFFKETEAFAEDLSRRLKDENIALMKESYWYSDQWLPVYVIYCFGREVWYENRKFDLDGSYFFLAFFPKREHFCVSYSAGCDEVRIPESVDVTDFDVDDMPRIFFYENDVGWLDEGARESALLLDKQVIEELKSHDEERTGFELFYKFGLETLTEEEVEKTLDEVTVKLLILNKLIDKLGLRDNI
jgi:hypothetical protein